MVDVNLNIKVPAFEKLVDYTASGIGAVAGPVLAPWKERRLAAAKLTAAKGEADSLKLIAEARTEACRALLPSDEATHVVLEIGSDGGITQRIEFQEQKRQANIVSVVRDAAAELDGKEVDDHEPDPDWTARFFDSVQDISSDDMRKLWARILSGEVEEPGRTSLRTLDILKNMTTQDAGMFERICDFIVDGDFIFSDKGNNLDHLGVPFYYVLYLREIGLIDADLSLGKIIEFNKHNKWKIGLVYHKKILIMSARNESRDSRTITIPVYRLTHPGKELCRIVESKFHLDYLQSLARFLRTNNIDVSCARIIKKLSDGAYTHSAPYDPFEIESEQ